MLRQLKPPAESGGPNGGEGEPIAIVHCTHGINRTGYFIAHALVSLHGMRLDEALVRGSGLRRRLRPL